MVRFGVWMRPMGGSDMEVVLFSYSLCAFMIFVSTVCCCFDMAR